MILVFGYGLCGSVREWNGSDGFDGRMFEKDELLFRENLMTTLAAWSAHAGGHQKAPP
jgi:hypothetical protein